MTSLGHEMLGDRFQVDSKPAVTPAPLLRNPNRADHGAISQLMGQAHEVKAAELHAQRPNRTARPPRFTARRTTRLDSNTPKKADAQSAEPIRPRRRRIARASRLPSRLDDSYGKPLRQSDSRCEEWLASTRPINRAARAASTNQSACSMGFSTQ
jgi:hypothetical protein